MKKEHKYTLFGIYKPLFYVMCFFVLQILSVISKDKFFTIYGLLILLLIEISSKEE